MRRFVSIFVLAIFGLFAAAPLTALSTGDAEASLPACCRRAGHHHCSMMANGSGSASTDTQLRKIEQRCPLYPHAAAAPAGAFHVAPAASAVHYASLTSHPAIHAQTQCRYRVSLDRSRQKRGPPTLL